MIIVVLFAVFLFSLLYFCVDAMVNALVVVVDALVVVCFCVVWCVVCIVLVEQYSVGCCVRQCVLRFVEHFC